MLTHIHINSSYNNSPQTILARSYTTPQILHVPSRQHTAMHGASESSEVPSWSASWPPRCPNHFHPSRSLRTSWICGRCSSLWSVKLKARDMLNAGILMYNNAREIQHNSKGTKLAVLHGRTGLDCKCLRLELFLPIFSLSTVSSVHFISGLRASFSLSTRWSFFSVVSVTVVVEDVLRRVCILFCNEPTGQLSDSRMGFYRKGPQYVR